MAAAARQDAADRPRSRAASSRTRRSSAASPTPQPYDEWLKETQFKLEDLPERRGAGAPRGTTIRRRCSIASRRSATPQEDLQFFLEPMAAHGDDPIGSMGTDTPIAVLSDAAEAALRLLQAELRPGHQPADRSDPRGAGDVAGLDDRAAAEPARPPGRHAQAARSRAADPDQRGPGEDPRDRRAARTAPSAPRRSTPPGRPADGAGGLERGARAAVLRGDRGGAGRQQHPDPVGPRGRPPTASRSRRRWPPRRCTTT